jgi:hypothetical protein
MTHIKGSFRPKAEPIKIEGYATLINEINSRT